MKIKRSGFSAKILLPLFFLAFLLVWRVDARATIILSADGKSFHYRDNAGENFRSWLDRFTPLDQLKESLASDQGSIFNNDQFFQYNGRRLAGRAIGLDHRLRISRIDAVRMSSGSMAFIIETEDGNYYLSLNIQTDLRQIISAPHVETLLASAYGNLLATGQSSTQLPVARTFSQFSSMEACELAMLMDRAAGQNVRDNGTIRVTFGYMVPIRRGREWLPDENRFRLPLQIESLNNPYVRVEEFHNH